MMELTVRQMTRPELDVLVGWAGQEGWNPGVNDADIFWATDREGFVAAELEGELIGGGSIVSYGGAFGFMGFFIVRPDRRGQGLGRQLWYARRQRLIERLDPGAAIGMDGVYEMVPFYRDGGFELLHRDIRFQGTARQAPADTSDTIDAATVAYEALVSYDRQHFPAPRSEFLRSWLTQQGGHAVATVEDGEVSGYAVSRPCQAGHKVGPLFADSPEIAERLFLGLCAHLEGEQVQLDVPECNPHALDLARRQGLAEVFGCARMTYGPAPDLPYEEIYGVTTFELG